MHADKIQNKGDKTVDENADDDDWAPGGLEYAEEDEDDDDEGSHDETLLRSLPSALMRQARLDKPSQHFDEGALPAETSQSTTWMPTADYHMFYQQHSAPFDVAGCAWATNKRRLHTIPARTALDKVPLHKRHKMAMVVKDKDLVLRNATVTDTVVPIGRKVDGPAHLPTIWGTKDQRWQMDWKTP